jgi:hypothetical protein
VHYWQQRLDGDARWARRQVVRRHRQVVPASSASSQPRFALRGCCTLTHFSFMNEQGPQPLRGGRPSLFTTSSTPFAHIDSTGGVGESPTPV